MFVWEQDAAPLCVLRKGLSTLNRATWNLLLVVLLLAGGAFIWATRVQPADTRSPGGPPAPVSASAEPAPLPDHPAPDFTLATTDGATVSLGALKGQVVLVNVWATWCPPCRAEMPAVQAAYERYQDQGFTVLGVNQQEDAGAVAAFMAEHSLTFPALLDADGRVSSAYQARVVPSSFFVDRRGVVRVVYRGPMPQQVIAGTVEQLLGEAP